MKSIWLSILPETVKPRFIGLSFKNELSFDRYETGGYLNWSSAVGGAVGANPGLYTGDASVLMYYYGTN